ncbi:MAG: helix-turn-helix domain-containing protein [Bdellovibrionales bacterium]|nr:helix-turn-helix domain-containing protein [Bdellovibrionales bacterium]
MTIEQEWFTTEEAAEYLRISPASLRNMTSNGLMPYYKIGKRNRYLKEELKKLLMTQKRGPKNESSEKIVSRWGNYF